MNMSHVYILNTVFHLKNVILFSISHLMNSLMFPFCEYLLFIELDTIESGCTSEQNIYTRGNWWINNQRKSISMVTDDQKVLRLSAGIDMGNEKWKVPSFRIGNYGLRGEMVLMRRKTTLEIHLFCISKYLKWLR